jgi:hypothetical protein
LRDFREVKKMDALCTLLRGEFEGVPCGSVNVDNKAAGDVLEGSAAELHLKVLSEHSKLANAICILLFGCLIPYKGNQQM